MGASHKNESVNPIRFFVSEYILATCLEMMIMVAAIAVTLRFAMTREASRNIFITAEPDRFAIPG